MSVQIINSSIPLIIDKKVTEMIKPSKEIPFQMLSLSTLDNDPNNEVIYKAIYVFKSKIDCEIIPEILLKEALSDLLVYYYPMSGRLKRRETDRKLELRCGGDNGESGCGGVAFTVANANVELSTLKYLENIEMEIALKLVPEIHVDLDGYSPFALQVTKFECGGLVLGMAMSHAICDGYGEGHFMCGLAALTGNKKLKVIPVWERERLVGKPNNQPPYVPDGDTAASPYLPTDDWVTERINITFESIKKLKETTLQDNNISNETLTTFEVLGAYLWKSRVKALRLDQEGITVFGFSVGIRDVVDPPLPDGYYGNAFIDIYVPLTVKEVEKSTIFDIIKLIKEAKRNARDKEHLDEELSNIEKCTEMNLEIKGRKDGVLVLTDWRNIGIFDSMDFGWGEPVNLLPVLPAEAARMVDMLMRPSKLEPDMVGGVQVMVTLPRVAMVMFKEEIKGLDM